MTLELLTEQQLNENDLLSLGLDNLAQIGAKKMLKLALELEVQEYIDKYKDKLDSSGKRLVVRNGKSRSRKITTGTGTFDVQTPRINDKRAGQKFVSKILPPYLRRSANVCSVLPILYLKGLSGNAFQEALKSLLGEEASGLSSSSISELKKKWIEEFNNWSRRDILENYLYFWCDGVNLEVRLGDDKRVCLLVVIGVNEKGEKKLIAVEPGYKESKEAWKELFTDLESRGLKSPLMVVGDGALGLWSAIREMELFSNTKEQRCWVHKMSNVLDKLPKRLQAQAKSLLREMMMAPSSGECYRQRKIFEATFNEKYPKAVDCLNKDWDELNNFFNLPAEQWTSLRTTNPIESAFASVKLRTTVTKGAGSIKVAPAMAFKLLKECEKKWRPIRGHKHIPKQLQGAIYKDGILIQDPSNQEGVA